MECLLPQGVFKHVSAKFLLDSFDCFYNIYDIYYSNCCAAGRILTGLVLSPKKWMDENLSFSTIPKQYLLSQPSGNTSKLIWPPAEEQQKENINTLIQL